MVHKQKNDEQQFDVHPPLSEIHPLHCVEHINARKHHQYKGGNSNNVPQTLFHKAKLLMENRTLGFLFFQDFGVIDKKAHHIKKSSEVAHYKDDMDAFSNKIINHY